MTAGHRDDSDRTIMVTAKSAGREMTRGGGGRVTVMAMVEKTVTGYCNRWLVK